jgi:hypothetical protein
MSPTTFASNGVVPSIAGVVRTDGVILRGALDNKNTALENLAAIAQERTAIGN